MSDASRFGEYLLSNSAAAAGVRFAALSELFDRWTLEHLDRLGLAQGWRCWEVGAGGPDIAAALAARVGASGRVVATDIDISWAGGVAGGPLEVLRHDVVTETPPGQDFDLIHARLVLVHLPDRDRVIRRLVEALRPGGWLVIEDADPLLQPMACPDVVGADEILANRLRDGFRALMAERGVDLGFGRKLPRLLRAAGLDAVTAEAFLPLGGAALARLDAATTSMLAEPLVAAGLASETEIAAHFAALESGELSLTTAPLITCWGRKP